MSLKQVPLLYISQTSATLAQQTFFPLTIAPLATSSEKIEFDTNDPLKIAPIVVSSETVNHEQSRAHNHDYMVHTDRSSTVIPQLEEKNDESKIQNKWTTPRIEAEFKIFIQKIGFILIHMKLMKFDRDLSNIHTVQKLSRHYFH